LEAAAKPKGLFDRTTQGLSIGPVPVLIERGSVRFFAQVLGIDDPVHTDLDAARAAGHPDLMAPASFFVVVDASANEALKRQSISTAAERVRCDYRYLLHGEERYFYEAPLYAGEEVEIGTTILDFYEKKGGAMEFVTLESTIRHPKRGVLVRARRTLLHRLPKAAP